MHRHACLELSLILGGGLGGISANNVLLVQASGATFSAH